MVQTYTGGSQTGRPRSTNGVGNRKTKQNPLAGSVPDFGGKQTLMELPLPALSPESTANYYAQLGNLYSSLQLQLAASKQARVGIKADARVGMADARATAIGEMAGAVNSGLDRGILNSSIDLEARSGVRAAHAGAKAQIQADKREGLAATRLADQGAALDYQAGSLALEGQRIAEIQNTLRDQLLQNSIVSGLEGQVDALQSVYEALAGMSAGGGAGAAEGHGGVPRWVRRLGREPWRQRGPGSITESGQQIGGGF
jgi:hypothetical protein